MNLLQQFCEISRASKRLIMLGFDLVALHLALLTAVLVRLGDIGSSVEALFFVGPAVVLFTLFVFARFGLYRAVIRYMGTGAIYATLKGVTLSALLLAALVLVYGSQGFPRSIIFIYWLLALLYVGGSRYLLRELLAQKKSRLSGKATIIYGAGEAGHQLSVFLSHSDSSRPMCFIDDNPGLHGSRVNGLLVYSPADLQKLIDEYAIERVLLALPNVGRARRKEIIDALEPYPVHVYTVPSLGDIVSGEAQVDDIREVEIDDLLGRDPVPPNDALLHACIKGKVVMVTGAGGSIGSELCRQILRLEPRMLVLFELSEFSLYQIEQELLASQSALGTSVPVKALLGSVQDSARLRGAMNTFGVNTVYHAAAYKHVPMVEHNMAEGILNNTFGTLHAAQAAVECGVDTFVLISTDKAVRPTNVMGASKRFAELVLQGMAREQSPTRFCMVRFGNVLNSSGSVVPVFREQIRKGGPVTVTHPDIVRYFMTIPEAAQLVIQAGSMGTGGDVFVLDMGKPVKIVDLARKMIHLMGRSVSDEHTPGGDVTIEFTGLRPGEKLYEELLIGDNVTGTEHPMIMRAEEVSFSWSEMEGCIGRMRVALDSSDHTMIRSILKEVVSGYQPSGPIMDHLRSSVSPKPVDTHLYH